MKTYTYGDVQVPDGQIGEWRVETFEVTEEDAFLSNLQAAFGRPLERVIPGTYKRLMRGPVVVMSNTPMEKTTNRPIVRMASGNVLINGLGLGMILSAVLEKPEVQKVIVVEKHREVIDLVGPHFASHGLRRLEIVHDDALTFRPSSGLRFQAVWHDIWDYICGDNLEEMKTLTRKYGRRAEWQGSWCRSQCEAQMERSGWWR